VLTPTPPIKSGEVDVTYAGPTAPLTCLDVNAFSVFAGCWNKTIYAWKVSEETTKIPQRPVAVHANGHTDFVKTLSTVALGDKLLLITGSADASIVIWEIGSGKKLHVLKGHARGVQALAIDHVASTAQAIEFVSADSTNEIRRWRVTATAAEEISMVESEDVGLPIKPLIAHETSVYALYFDADGDLWTASADKTAKCLVRERQWKADTTLEHPDFVRDVVVDEEGGWVITACRDEEIRVWERSSGKLFHIFSGHHEEVTGLLLVGRKLVSISIDATMRTWSLLPKDLQKAKEDAQSDTPAKPEEPPVQSSSVLTEEEERELAELMEDDD
jgi:hypothetical protein